MLIALLLVLIGLVGFCVSIAYVYAEMKAIKESEAVDLQSRIIDDLRKELDRNRKINSGDIERQIYERKIELINAEHGYVPEKPRTEYEILLEDITRRERDIAKPLEQLVSEATEAVEREYTNAKVQDT